MGNADRIYLKGEKMKSEKPYKHFVAISVGNEGTKERYQAVCNPIKCGWYGTVTSDLSLAEAERDEHIRSVSA